MEIVLGTAGGDELAGFLRPIWTAFGSEPSDDDVERFGPLLDLGRMHVAREDGAIVGSAGAFTFETTVPGGTVPAAGVTVVGVLPTHRRRGLLTRLMREQLDDVHRRGEPIAYLWATDERIYGRFGYGLASLVLHVEVDPTRVTVLGPTSGGARVRLLDEEAAFGVIPPLYDELRGRWPGMFSRTDEWWRKRLLHDRGRGPGTLYRAVLELDGVPQAYALYRTHMDFNVFAATITVAEALGATTEATRELWRYLLSVDLVKTLKAGRLPLDHPLPLLVDRPRALDLGAADGLFVRLVDVEAALAARSLGDGEVVVEVADAFCPWNEGRWRITGAGAERTDAEAGIACDVTALGAVYLGGFAWRDLLRAGRVEERREGAVAAADALFAWDTKPWCPEIF